MPAIPPTPRDPPFTIAGIPVRAEPSPIGCASIWQYIEGGRVVLYGTTVEGLVELQGSHIDNSMGNKGGNP